METLIQNQENTENFERIEKDSKVNLKETLNTRRTANRNQYEINNIKKVVKNNSLRLNATNTVKEETW